MTGTRTPARAAAPSALALVLGLVIMTASFWNDTTPAARGMTLGLGALAAVFALWSLLTRDPTTDHRELAIVGLVLIMTPWVGQFAGDGAAWTTWIAGAAVMLIGAASYLRDDAFDVAGTVQAENAARYLAGPHRAAATGAPTEPAADTLDARM